jgi:hypothetical protein
MSSAWSHAPATRHASSPHRTDSVITVRTSTRQSLLHRRRSPLARPLTYFAGALGSPFVIVNTV